MLVREIGTDYLIVGAGAAGMAFADTVVSDSDAEVVIVDRRHAPGGHWNDAYPFVRLHQPAMYYGVNSMPLGTDTIDQSGLNSGLYVQASAPEICAYYDRVMRERLLPSGRVRYLPMSEHTGDGRVVSRLTGDSWDIKARKAFVDARYLEPGIPKTTPPPFEVEPGVRCVPVDELPQVTGNTIMAASVTNGMPSIHFSTALLIAWALWRWKWGRVFGIAFAIATMVATLGSGEHYLCDLVMAVPYALFVGWCGRRIASKRFRTASGCGAGERLSYAQRTGEARA